MSLNVSNEAEREVGGPYSSWLGADLWRSSLYTSWTASGLTCTWRNITTNCLQMGCSAPAAVSTCLQRRRNVHPPVGSDHRSSRGLQSHHDRTLRSLLLDAIADVLSEKTNAEKTSRDRSKIFQWKLYEQLILHVLQTELWTTSDWRSGLTSYRLIWAGLRSKWTAVALKQL